jgi:hypothetical protein
MVTCFIIGLADAIDSTIWNEVSSFTFGSQQAGKYVEDEALRGISGDIPANEALPAAVRILVQLIKTDQQFGDMFSNRELLPALWQVPFVTHTFSTTHSMHEADMAAWKQWYFSNKGYQRDLCPKSSQENPCSCVPYFACEVQEDTRHIVAAQLDTWEAINSITEFRNIRSLHITDSRNLLPQQAERICSYLQKLGSLRTLKVMGLMGKCDLPLLKGDD